MKQIFFRKVIITVMLCLFISLAFAKGTPTAEKVATWRKAAEQNDTDAQYNLGVCYATGQGVPKSDAEAARWWRKAAEQGLANAQSKLGTSYIMGAGVPEDSDEAVKWWLKAAEQCDADAQCNLGISYNTGKGAPKDIAKAVSWWRKASDQGNARAQYWLGDCYDSGKGVPKDITKAFTLFRQAAVQGDINGQYNLGVYYSSGKGVTKDPSEAVKWWSKAADQGNDMAAHNLGVSYYLGGNGTPKDYAEAAKWFRKAADQGNANSQFNMGACYADGTGVSKDNMMAYMWFDLAAASGHPGASKARETLKNGMTEKQIENAQKLRKEWKPNKIGADIPAPGVEPLHFLTMETSFAGGKVGLEFTDDSISQTDTSFPLGMELPNPDNKVRLLKLCYDKPKSEIRLIPKAESASDGKHNFLSIVISKNSSLRGGQKTSDSKSLAFSMSNPLEDISFSMKPKGNNSTVTGTISWQSVDCRVIEVLAPSSNTLLGSIIVASDRLEKIGSERRQYAKLLTHYRSIATSREGGPDAKICCFQVAEDGLKLLNPNGKAISPEKTDKGVDVHSVIPRPGYDWYVQIVYVKNRSIAEVIQTDVKRGLSLEKSAAKAGESAHAPEWLKKGAVLKEMEQALTTIKESDSAVIETQGHVFLVVLLKRIDEK